MLKQVGAAWLSVRALPKTFRAMIGRLTNTGSFCSWWAARATARSSYLCCERGSVSTLRYSVTLRPTARQQRLESHGTSTGVLGVLAPIEYICQREFICAGAADVFLAHMREK